jgi:hypothetical protein
MKNQVDRNRISEPSFLLDKWFLDFTGENGAAMIFYAAKLTWYGLSVSYTSWLSYDKRSGVIIRSRFSKVQVPQITGNLITWDDPIYRISGRWESAGEMIQARLFEGDEGSLEWKCHQPASNVQLSIGESLFAGRGYAEQLILTVPPWKIPMDELRWGRFGSDESTLVWIELRDRETRKWLWVNGERTGNCTIEDTYLSIPDKELFLTLDRGVVLESEKKIYTIVEKLVRYLPGFKKILPLNFLMADETKWLSRAELHSEHDSVVKGMAIHELVRFNG